MDKNYNSILYSKYNIDFSSYVSNLLEYVHKELYKLAIDDLVKSLPYFEISYQVDPDINHFLTTIKTRIFLNIATRNLDFYRTGLLLGRIYDVQYINITISDLMEKIKKSFNENEYIAEEGCCKHEITCGECGCNNDKYLNPNNIDEYLKNNEIKFINYSEYKKILSIVENIYYIFYTVNYNYDQDMVGESFNNKIDSINKTIQNTEIRFIPKDLLKIEEIPDKNELLPSKAIIWYNAIINTTNDNKIIVKKEIIDLSKYWNNEYIFKMYNKKSRIITDPDTMETAKIIKYNYIGKYAVLYSRYTGNSFIVPFSLLSENYQVDPDFTLSDTFTQKYLLLN